MKFPYKGSHQIFVEPDSLETGEIYLAGLSTSMPVEVQEKMVRSLPGFESAEIVRPGYAIEYDSYDPLQLTQHLSLKEAEGLWFAGQINGTTGYEEAAGQGFLAGVNAARFVLGAQPFLLGREDAYLGVMVDDLVTKGVDEPYRMLTARAEHRLDLACDLADVRLLDQARRVGIRDARALDGVLKKQERRALVRERLRGTRVTPNSELGRMASEGGVPLSGGLALFDLLKRQQMTDDLVARCLALVPEWVNAGDGWDRDLEQDLMLFEARYAPIREREARLQARGATWEQVRIPHDFRIEHLPGFSREVKEKLLHHRPETLGQASRIPGITPAAVTLLHLLIERRE